MIRIPELRAREIELVPVGPLDDAVLRNLAPELKARFHVDIQRGEPLPIERDWLDTTRDQYRAGPILDAIVDRRRPGFRSLGIIDADIFAPNLDFIFGQAIVGGCCAIIGLARLREEFYHREADAELFARRTLIEAVHELGHTSGLDHCPDRHCVMFFSRTIQDSDRKGPDFCRICDPLRG